MGSNSSLVIYVTKSSVQSEIPRISLLQGEGGSGQIGSPPNAIVFPLVSSPVT